MDNNTLFHRIYEAARELGYEIYVVGGYVRDKILGIESKDIDFVLVGDAMVFSELLKRRLCLRNIIRYQRFGTFMAKVDDYLLEFVNAREESYQDDSRKPVTRQADLYTDLSRRDFTINTLAMSIDPENYGNIIDRYDGIADLKNGIIRTPLEPEKTFKDDPLRMMRAVRFATRFSFTIDSGTMEAIKRSAHRLEIISRERITDELNKILRCSKPSTGFRLLDQTGLLEWFLPEMEQLKGVEQRDEFHHKDVFYHTLEVLDNVAGVSDKLELRLAALFHDIGKPKTKKFIPGTGWTFYGHDVVGERMTRAILRRLRYSKQQIQYVQKIVRLHLRPMAVVDEEVTDSAVRRLIVQAGDEIDDLMTLCRADITSKNPERVKAYLSNYERVAKKIVDVEERDRIRNFQPPVDGNEIMDLFDLEPGPVVGKIKKFVEDAILNGQVPNDHDACLDLIREHQSELLG
jgi:putative nucleotidyltransferase with HDIG domain